MEKTIEQLKAELQAIKAERDQIKQQYEDLRARIQKAPTVAEILAKRDAKIRDNEDYAETLERQFTSNGRRTTATQYF